MKNQIRQTQVKYPQNKLISAKLNQGDRVIIAHYAGLKPGTVRDMFNGYRRITDNVARAIIRLMNERQQIASALDNIINSNNL